MKGLGILLIALLLTCVAGGPTDCKKTYQQLIEDAAKLKKSCSEANLKDCCQVHKVAPWSPTGTYEVAEVCETPHVFGTKTVKQFARCDMESAGGKWMVIQRRINGSVDFYRNWTDYVYGFGDLEGEFWYGLENIHCLTTREDVELRIELGNRTEPSIVWTYQLFQVGGADTNYQLTIGQGNGVGSTYDSLNHNNERQFSTKDNDNDASSTNCAVNREGAWWYGDCSNANLNGRYGYFAPSTFQGIIWYDGSKYLSFTKVQMKIRPKSCSIEEDTTCE